MATILVADDEESILKLVSLVLTTAGHKVLTASNGVEAVALYRSYNKLIDVVLTDLNMPVLDGYQVVLLIRQTKPNVKVICMTGNIAQPIPEGVLLLQKPFVPAKLTR